MSEVIDVILPFHRVDDLLLAAIRSLHNSRGVKVRIIAVNDTGIEINKEDLELLNADVLVANSDHGYVNALKCGVSASSSGYIAFQDSDDLSHPDRLRNALDLLNSGQFSLVTGKLIKFIDKVEDESGFNLLGKVPTVKNQRHLWMLGTHGADSSIVGDGELIRNTWEKHSRFDARFADFGWMLSLDQSVTIGHSDYSIYFYRMHANQISRRQNISSGWEEIFFVWRESMSQIDTFFDLFENANFTKNVALALVMPASLIKLSPIEQLAMRKTISSILKQLKNEGAQDLSDWKFTLHARYLIASRGKDFRSWWVAPKLILNFAKSLAAGYRPRND